MVDKDIASLYSSSRFPCGSSAIIKMMVYTPVGVVLFIGRVLLGSLVLLLAYLLPDASGIQRILNKLLCATLGIYVDVNNPEKKEDVLVYMSNYVSPLDYLAVRSVTGCVTPASRSINSPLLRNSLGIHYFGTWNGNFEVLKKNIAAYLTKATLPLYLQPEWKATNGSGVLKFKTWPFALCDSVQPISIVVDRPYLGANVATADSTNLTNLFYYLFSPYTIYKFKFLQTVQKQNLSDEEFAERVRQVIANDLKVQPLQYSASDLLEWEKRNAKEQQRRQVYDQINALASNMSPDILRMARQVKEVLPMVPDDVVYTDLTRTRNVDYTITNILEGHVRYTPIFEKSSSSLNTYVQQRPSTSPCYSAARRTDADCLCTAASSFGKSAQERTSSFKDRKRMLIENARKRYIEKRGLNIVGSP